MSSTTLPSSIIKNVNKSVKLVRKKEETVEKEMSTDLDGLIRIVGIVV
jgi:hypothetical protein